MSSGAEPLGERRGAQTFVRAILHVLVAAAIGTFAWLYRFDDPVGSFAGLTDDHFFYVVRGWQMLFGELPSRDFVDPGAPLTFVLAAATQWLGGRGTLSEMIMCVSALSLGAVLTYAIAARASASIVLGIVAAALQIALMTRLYNYPKIVVYAVAIPLLWAFANKPSPIRRFALALLTAIAFLLRYDHGVFVGLAVATLLLLMSDVPWRARMRHALVYAGLVVLLLTPYLAYLQANGGIVFQFQTANSWSQRDRARAPLVWPAFTLGVDSADAGDEPPPTFLARLARVNEEAWIFYLFLLLPLACLAMLWRAPQAFRPDWPRGRIKIAVVAVLAVALDLGFLRGNLSARFADVSVPQVVLLAWLLMACLTLRRTGQWDGGRPATRAARVLLPAAALTPVILTGLMIVVAHRDREVLVSLTEARSVINRFRSTWPLDDWSNRSRPGPIRLAHYLEACTTAGDHVFVTPYLPQVIALSGRPFAGGHGDLRPDFYNTDAHQRLTIERLQRQSVPIVIMPPQNEREGFRKSFPLLDDYLRSRFRPAGTLDLGEDEKPELLVDRTRSDTGRFDPFGWPCFR